MIRRLQVKFVAIVMTVLVAVFAITFITLNAYMNINSSRQIEMILKEVVSQDGILLPLPDIYPPSEKNKLNHNDSEEEVLEFTKPFPYMMKAGRLFCVKTDHYDNIIEANFDMIFDFTFEKAAYYVDLVLEKGQMQGNIDTFQYLIVEKEYGKIIVFSERSIEMQMLSKLIYTSLTILGISCIVFFIFSILLSKWAVKPVKDSFEKQRRFISDASHELKTPLTIISANADVLENEIGINDRIHHIKDQSIRMNQLIYDMLALAKMDESENKISLSEFDISRTVLNSILEFESRAFEEGKKFDYDIEKNIYFTGNKNQIKQLVSIFTDNAIKHSNESGEIKISLKKQNGKIKLSFFNTGEGVQESDKNKIFERFYRSDDSRSRETGGYGLGLAIAKNIIDIHKGKIQVLSESGRWVCFTIIL